ncbi:hypothetical protein [Actinomyces oricola]
MSFSFNHGPVTTTRSLSEISDIIREVSDAKRFMSVIRRKVTTSSIGKGNFIPFTPTQDDDPFSTGAPPDWAIGFETVTSVTNSMGMTYTEGYRAIFRVYKTPGGARIDASVDGVGALRREAQKFIKFVFDRL